MNLTPIFRNIARYSLGPGILASGQYAALFSIENDTVFWASLIGVLLIEGYYAAAKRYGWAT